VVTKREFGEKTVLDKKCDVIRRLEYGKVCADYGRRECWDGNVIVYVQLLVNLSKPAKL
jgi:hypothetical protein